MSGESLRLEPRQCALIIVYMQNDFVSPGGYHHQHGASCEHSQAIIPNIALLLKELPRELRRVYIATERQPDGSDYHWRFHNILPDQAAVRFDKPSLIRGTWGAEIVEQLKPQPEDTIIYKRRFSGFFQTDLELVLRCMGIKTLLFTGVGTQMCVETTLRDGFQRDFDIILASDGVASYDPAGHENTLRLVRRSFGAVLPVQEILKINWL